MTLVHILAAVIEAILRVIAEAVRTALTLLLGGMFGIALLVGLGVLGMSGLGAAGIVRWRRGRRNGRD